MLGLKRLFVDHQSYHNLDSGFFMPQNIHWNKYQNSSLKRWNQMFLLSLYPNDYNLKQIQWCQKAIDIVFSNIKAFWWNRNHNLWPNLTKNDDFFKKLL